MHGITYRQIKMLKSIYQEGKPKQDMIDEAINRMQKKRVPGEEIPNQEEVRQWFRIHRYSLGHGSKQKKGRMVYSQDQYNILVSLYDLTQGKPSEEDQLGAIGNMLDCWKEGDLIPTFKQVSRWFSNYRHKYKTGEVSQKHFSGKVIELLYGWFTSHVDNPYPTEQEKKELRKVCGLTRKQLDVWFTNARRRYLDTGNVPRGIKRKIQYDKETENLPKKRKYVHDRIIGDDIDDLRARDWTLKIEDLLPESLNCEKR